MNAVVRNTIGMFLIAAGVAGVLLPIIPGIPLLAAGAAMLGKRHPLVRAGWRWLRKIWKPARKRRNGAPPSGIDH